MKLLTASAIAALTATAALADPIEFEFDKTHTVIEASWDHLGFSTQSIQFTDYDGTVVLDFDDPSNSVIDITFNLIDGFWVGANQDRFIGHLNSADLFNTAEFPTARFVATGFETEDGETGTMTGDLTLLGQTHPVTLNVTTNNIAPHPFNPDQLVAGFDANGTISRSQWGLGYASPNVSEEIAIHISTEFNAPNPDAE